MLDRLVNNRLLDRSIVVMQKSKMTYAKDVKYN